MMDPNAVVAMLEAKDTLVVELRGAIARLEQERAELRAEVERYKTHPGFGFLGGRLRELRRHFVDRDSVLNRVIIDERARATRAETALSEALAVVRAYRHPNDDDTWDGLDVRADALLAAHPTEGG